MEQVVNEQVVNEQVVYESHDTSDSVRRRTLVKLKILLVLKSVIRAWRERMFK